MAAPVPHRLWGRAHFYGKPTFRPGETVSVNTWAFVGTNSRSALKSTPISGQRVRGPAEFFKNEGSEVVYDRRSKSFTDSDTNFNHRYPV